MAAIFSSIFKKSQQPLQESVPCDKEFIFPKVVEETDGIDCNSDCSSCVIKYPRGFSIDEDDELYGNIKEWSTHILVATGKSDWVHNVSDEVGSVMEAIENTEIKPSNGKLKLSASNIPIPPLSDGYAGPTTVLLLPAWTIVENVTPKSVDKLITDFVDKSPTTSAPLEPLTLPQSLETSIPGADVLHSRPCPHSAIILLCSQGKRDSRCGQSAPLLRKEFERHLRGYGLFRNLDDERPGGVGIYFISHVGGHKYSANVLIYRKEDAFGIDQISRATVEGKLLPRLEEENKTLEGAAQCIWLARVKPGDCEGIIKFTVLQGKVVNPEKQLRGGFDRRREVTSW